MPKGKRRRTLYGAAVSFGYGALLETLQLLVPARAPSALDLAINLAGALTGAIAGTWALCGDGPRRRRRTWGGAAER